MEQKKRKISARKVLQAVVTLIMTTGCFVAILSASDAQHNRTVNQLNIRISNQDACNFLTAAQVRTLLLDNRHIIPEETPISALDLSQMEAIIRSNPWVSEAEVYVDNTNTLHVVARQRVPALRIFEQGGHSYYLDTTGNILPLSENYTHYTTIITNVPELKNDSISNALKAHMLKLAQTIEADSFWNAQVAGITMKDDYTFELTPVLGKHRILIGDTSRIETKLNYILAFYKQVLNRIGWDKYEVIDARYRGQVVVSPQLPWRPPRDKAMTTINWVKSITGNTTPASNTNPVHPTTTASTKVVHTTATPSTQPKPEHTPKHENVSTVKNKMPLNNTKEKSAIAPKPPATETKQPAPPANKKVEPKKEKEENQTPKYLYQGN